MERRIVSMIVLFAILITSACNESTIIPDDNNDIEYPYVFYSHTGANDNMDLHKININTLENELFRETAMIIGIVNEKIYYASGASGVNLEIRTCDYMGENDELIYQTDPSDVLPFFDLSNDGTKLILYKELEGSIYCIDLLTSTATKIKDLGDWEGSIEFNIAGLTADSKQIDICYQTEGYYSPYYNTVATCNVDGTDLQEHVTGNLIAYVPYSRADGSSQLVYMDIDDSYSYTNIKVYDTDSKTTKTLTTDTGYKHFVTCSPDGSKISFYRPNDKFCVMNSDGSNEITLSDGISNTVSEVWNIYPQWSADGNQVVFWIYAG